MEAIVLGTSEPGVFRVRIEAEQIAPGKLPVRDLTQIGRLIQDGLERTARLLSEERGIAPGPLPGSIREATQLLLVAVESGSAVLALELPAPSETEAATDDGRLLPLPPKDLGFRAMDVFVGGLHELESSKDVAVPARWDNSIMEVAEGLASYASERSFSITLEARSPVRGLRVARISPAIADRFTRRRAPIQRRRSAHGRLILIDLGRGRVDVEDRRGHRVECQFAFDSEQLAAQAKRLIGEWVAVAGTEEFDVAMQKAGRLEIESLEPAGEEVPLSEAFWLNTSASEQARDQGVSPIASVSELARPDLFTDEEIESFVAAIREARREE